MSVAWMAPVTLWKEPAWALALRVVVRLALAFFWAFGAVLAPWATLSMALSLLAVFALAHAGLAIANRFKNRGVLLELMGSGAIEWRRSYQEQWFKRPRDWADGTAIEVSPIEPLPVWAPAAPHVTLIGATHQITRLPLYRTKVPVFMERVNALLAPRGIALVELGTVRKPRGREAD